MGRHTDFTDEDLDMIYEYILSKGLDGITILTLKQHFRKVFNRFPCIENNLFRLDAMGYLLAEDNGHIYAVEALEREV